MFQRPKWFSKLPLYASIALIITNILTFAFWQGTEARLAKEQSAHQQTVEVFKTTQRIADERAKAIQETLTKEAKDDAKRADENYASLLSRYQSNLLRYQANQRSPDGPSTSNNPAPTSSDGPSRGPQLPTGLEISIEDAKICADNTARLVSVREWALTLPK